MNETKELTFNDLPTVLQEMRDRIEQSYCLIQNLQPPKPARRPIFIKQASEILGKAENTVYKLSHAGMLPCYRQGRRIYFFEDELLEFINDGKIRSVKDIREDAIRSIYKGTPKHI